MLKPSALLKWVAAILLVCLVAGLVPSSAHAVMPPHGMQIRANARAVFMPPDAATAGTAYSNEVVATVQAVEALELSAGQQLTRLPMMLVTLPHRLKNVGNVTSDVTLNWENNGAACSADSSDLSGLRLVRDVNGNGVADPGEEETAPGQAGVLRLVAGESVSLLGQGSTAASPGALACLTMSATTVAQQFSVTASDTVTVGNGAILDLRKTAIYKEPVVPGQSDIRYVVSGTNIGSSDLLPTPTDNAAAPVTVDGANASMVLVRDRIPVGTHYRQHSLKTTVPGAQKLYRLRGDPLFSYRSAGDGDVIEVAIGISAAVAPAMSVSMEFAVEVERSAKDSILNVGQAFFSDGMQTVRVDSNELSIMSSPARLGLAKLAEVVPGAANGSNAPNAHASVTSVRFQLRAKNYGSATLHDVQISDILQGTGATQFGAYVAGIPAEGQYSIVPGSIVLAGVKGITANVAAPNPAFTGQGGARTLLMPGATLLAGSEVTVQFDVLVNLTGRTVTLLNRAMADAAPIEGGSITVQDQSTNGSDPDPDGDGNPGNNSEPTPVSVAMPALTLSKTASLPRRTSELGFEQDYVFRITNPGQRPVPFVRLVDNLQCMFGSERADGRIASWELAGTPVAQKGLLKVSSAFTGRAACDRAAIGKPDAAASLPYDPALSITDGSTALGAGMSETIRLTVRVTEKANYAGSRTVLANKAWAASFSSPAMTPEGLLLAVADKADTLLLDPMGIVYDQQTRLPVAGAVVSFTRTSCSSGAAAAISAGQLVGGDVPGVYTFKPDGSVAMSTGADGAYQFAPTAAAGMCTYKIAVTPPAGSGYRFPSLGLPASPGTFASCGAVVPSAQAPKAGESASHFLGVRGGMEKDGAACDVTHNHIPLDRGNLSGLILKKEGSKTQAELGDFLDYALTVVNKTGLPLHGVRFADQLPPGFAYIAGSAQLDGQRTAEPAGGAGPALEFSYPALRVAPDSTATVRYRVRIGVGAPTDGDAVNRASVRSGALRSNEASFKTRVSGGVFADEGFAFGKVHLDCKADGVQDGADEIGIPGVRLFLENGTSVVSDVEGKWSLYGLKPVTHVLRLDQTTLPSGARLAVLDNRNAGAPESRFLDIKKGEFHKANFIVDNCAGPGSAALLAEIARRRAAIIAQPDAESEAQVRQRLNAEGNVLATGDRRALPASGQALPGGAVGATTPPAAALIRLPAAAAGGASFINGAAGTLGGTLGYAGPGATVTPAAGVFSPLLALPQQGSLPAAPSVDLESLLPALDNAVDFIALQDGQSVASQVINVRVKGPAGSTLQLMLNGQTVDARRVGKKTTLATRSLSAWEYVGVTLTPGANRLQLDAMDSFGNVRGTRSITLTAPDKLGLIHIVLPASARADQTTPVPVMLSLTDAAGVPVTARTPLTLETDRGRWLDTATVRDLDPGEPGMQIFIEGGSAQVNLMPPGEPGDVRIRASSGNLASEARLALLPELRPMIGVGIVEGVLDFTRRGKLALGDMPAGAAFESELQGLRKESGDKRGAARTAFFFKGAVKGEYLLTAAFDSDKTRRDRLFRDIRPDEFYPVYGDSATKNFDAQSTQKMYVRIDKDRSYLLYGDFTTSSSAEVRQLSQSNRSLTGVKQVYEDEDMRITGYASRTAQTQQVEEFRGLGISGPYYLSAGGGDFVVNSEQVEILIRDRNQPGTVVQRTPLTRNVDYTIEPMTRRILFTYPIPSANLNGDPQSIRTTYEIENGGPEFTVAGIDAQFKLGDSVQAGVVASMDDNPANKRRLSALTGIARVGEHTTVASEVVRTESDLRGDGNAARIEMRHQNDRLSAVALASKASAGFDNPGASFSAGRSEASARAEYKLDPTLALRGEVQYSKDAVDQERKGVAASVLKRLSDMTTLEAGMRHGQNDAMSSAGFDYGQASTYNNSFGGGAASVTSLGAANGGGSALSDESFTTARARLSTQVPYVPQAQVFIEGEQDIHQGDRRVLAVGGNYALTDKTRLYGRYEAISSLHGPYDLNAGQANNVGVLGIESNYMEGGRLYNEYRLADSIDGKRAQTALGVRNTFRIDDAWRVTGGIEHTRNLSGFSNRANNGTGYAGGLGESTAIITGLEYMKDRIKASGVAEARNGSDANTRLLSAGVGYKLDEDWSLLARSVLSDSAGRNASKGNERLLTRNQIGVAYRPVDQDVWNALARYEHKVERVRGAGNTPGSAAASFGSGSASLPGTYTADIVSTHLNVNPARGNYLTARYAGKISSARDDRSESTYWAHLLHARYTRDINSVLDAGVQTGMLVGKGGALQKTVGVEVGYQLYRNLWLSGGYNFVGLSDRDLTANEYTSKGAFLRLRWKFDETTLGFAATDARPVSLPMAATPPPAAPATTMREPEVLPVALPVSAPQPPAAMILEAAALFDSGKSVLKSGEHVALTDFAGRVRDGGSGAVHVVGHTDARGSAASNQKLSERRADAVRAYLVKQGIDAARIRSRGLGESQPVASNATASGRAMNRRVEIEVLASPVKGELK